MVIRSRSIGAPLLLLVVFDKTLLKLLVLSVVNGDLEQVDFIGNSVTEEEEERCHPPLTEPPQVRKIYCSDKRSTLNIKGLVHPKMKISLCFTHLRGILGVYDFLLSDESNRSYIKNCPGSSKRYHCSRWVFLFNSPKDVK